MDLLRDTVIKKRDGMELSQQELAQLVASFVAGEYPDYLMSAFLMAVYFRGLNESETRHLLSAMMSSGETLAWPEDEQKPVADKHSTGGIGDKTSFLVMPLLVAMGCRVPMIAGRGLGHTGGTLDKLEALPGASCDLSLARMKELLHACGGFIAGQTSSLVPADKKLYALRDVTGTVESIPLVVSSILSKKLAAGVRNLVLDVKFGNGSFFVDRRLARKLARALVETSRHFNCRTVCALTDMNSPLGTHLGNACEIEECLDILEGKIWNETARLSVELAVGVCELAWPQKSRALLKSEIRGHLSSGRAREIFLRVMSAQGARIADLERRDQNWLTGSIREVPVAAPHAGIVSGFATQEIGRFLVRLGAGRQVLGQPIDPKVGVVDLVSLGSAVEKGETIAVLRMRQEDPDAVKAFQKLLMIDERRADVALPKAPDDRAQKPISRVMSWIR